MHNPKVNFIREQSKLTRSQTLSVLKGIPSHLWYETPDVMETNVAWLTGHLIVSQYYHSIAVISGSHRDIFREVPLKEYLPIYSLMSKSTTPEVKPSPEKLLEDLETVNQHALRILDSLTDQAMEEPLEPTKFPHPIAKTKYEALTWSFRHEMWHLGQVATLGRILGYPVIWY